MMFYIASKLENHEHVNELATLLKAAGWRQTYDWTTHGRVTNDEDRMTEVADAEVEGVMDADVFILLLPGGRGTHVELGLALASGCRIFIHSFTPEEHFNERPCAFYFESDITRLRSETIRDLADFILAD